MQQFYFLSLGLFIYSITVSGQIIDYKNDKYWIDAGLGMFYTTGQTDGFSGSFSANLISDNTLYKIRFLYHTEFHMFEYGPTEKFFSVGLMSGRGLSGEYVQIHFSGGLGITGGKNRVSGPFERDYFITPSIPLEIDMIIKPLKYLGAGVNLWGDLNFKRPMSGMVLKLGIGKFR
jgi:hypothetical protein